MKPRFVIALFFSSCLLTIAIALPAISQPNGAKNDSTRLPNTQLRKAIAANEQYKLLKEQNSIQDRLLSIYDSTLTSADSLLSTQQVSLTLLKQKVGSLEQIAGGKEALISLCERDKAQLEQEKRVLKKELKGAVVKQWLAYGLALAAILSRFFN